MNLAHTVEPSLASQTIPQPTVIWVAVHPNDCRLGNGLASETKWNLNVYNVRNGQNQARDQSCIQNFVTKAITI